MNEIRSKRNKKSKGQSTMEYILLFAGLVLIALYAADHIKGKVTSQADKAGEIMDKGKDNLWNAVKNANWN